MSPRRAAKQASAPEATELAKDPSGEELLFGETLRKKGSSPIKYGGKNRVASGPSSRTGSSRPLSSSRKRELDSSTSDDDDVVLLSPLSSLPPTPSPKKKAVTKSLSQVSTSTSGLSFTVTEKPWNIEELGDYVWILVNLKGRPFDTTSQGESIKGEFLWWPGKVTSSSAQKVKATLYGNPASSSKTVSVNIKNPSADNVLSFLNQVGQPRFEEMSFRFPEVEISSPRKKRKHDETLKERWQEAVSVAIREKEHDYDGLPPPGLALSSGSLLASASAPPLRSPKQKGKGKIGTVKPLLDEDDGNDVRLKREDTPPVDDRLDVPGEGVLCKDRDSPLAVYWPARIQEYLVVDKKKGKINIREGLYRVLYLDGTSKDVPREWFYADHQDEFATCTVGKFQSEFVEDPDDDEGSDDEHDKPSESIARLASPIPTPLTSDVHFLDLNIHHQFCYTKPVLQAILNDRYQPAKPRHDKFMKGGGARKSLSNEAGLRGKMDPKDVSAIGKYLKQWCLRDSDRRQNQQGEIPPQERKDEAGMDVPMVVESLANDVVQPSERTANGDSPHKNATDVNSPTPTILPSSPAPLPPTSSFATTPEHDTQELPAAQSSTNNDVETGFSPQPGCPKYEALSTLEKIGYCADVLLPEAVLQILLWRNGDRTSIDLLSDEEEMELHEQGSKLVRETDWVFDIMRMRAMHEKRVAKADLKQAEGSQSLRPTRSTRNLRRG